MHICIFNFHPLDKYPLRVYHLPRHTYPQGVCVILYILLAPKGTVMEQHNESPALICPHCHETKIRDEKEYKDLINRLSRIEGQIRGIKRMVEENAYCTDIITQVAAVNAALSSFNRVLLANHIRTCVSDDIASGGTEKTAELVDLLSKLIK